MTLAINGRPSRRVKAAIRRIENIGALSAFHQHRPVREQRRRVLGPDNFHPLSGKSESSSHRIVKFRRLQCACAIFAARDKNPAVIEQRRSVIGSRCDHRAGRSDQARGGIVEQRRVEVGRLVQAAGNQYFAGLEEAGRMPAACPCAGLSLKPVFVTDRLREIPPTRPLSSLDCIPTL